MRMNYDGVTILIHLTYFWVFGNKASLRVTKGHSRCQSTASIGFNFFFFFFLMFFLSCILNKFLGPIREKPLQVKS